MTDWGDYPPGPWTLEEDWPGAYATRTIIRHGPGPTDFVQASNEDHARLISKAYLIPRLEAALESFVTAYRMPWYGEDGGAERSDAMTHAQTLADQALAELRSGL